MLYGTCTPMGYKSLFISLCSVLKLIALPKDQNKSETTLQKRISKMRRKIEFAVQKSSIV